MVMGKTQVCVQNGVGTLYATFLTKDALLLHTMILLNIVPFFEITWEFGNVSS